MTKSFQEIAMELTDLIEMGRCAGGGQHHNRVTRDDLLAIEAVLRREFGDNNGPTLERKVGPATVTEAKIDEKSYV